MEKKKGKRGPKHKPAGTQQDALIAVRVTKAQKEAFLKKHGANYTNVLRDFIKRNC